jgi:hypothetical protein
MGSGTSTLNTSLYMFVFGVGIGLSMQILIIIVQNTVAYRDLGVATSGVTFLRTLGSSFGAAVFGTIFANQLNHHLTDALRQTGVLPPGVLGLPSAVHDLPPAQSGPIIEAYAQSVHALFLYAVPVPLVAFALAWFLKEVPLRDMARAAAPDLGEGFGMPDGLPGDPGRGAGRRPGGAGRVGHEAGRFRRVVPDPDPPAHALCRAGGCGRRRAGLQAPGCRAAARLRGGRVAGAGDDR